MSLVSQHGAFLFSEARFSEAITVADPVALFVEGRFGLRLEVRHDRVGIVRAIYDSDQQNCPLLSCDFEFVETGCGQAKIKFNAQASTLDIEPGDRVDLFLMHAAKPWWTGRIIERPSVSTSRDATEYRAHGYAEELDSILVNEIYQNQSLGAVVQNLAATYLVGRDILWFQDMLPSVGYQVQSVQFSHVTLKEALRKLADLAHNWEFGIDEFRVLYFRSAEGKPTSRYSDKASWWVGMDCENFELAEDDGDVANVLRVKIGAVSSGSNFADFTAQDLDSIAFFGERAKVVSAPELKTSSDASTWAAYQLEELAWPKITGKIKGLNVTARMADRENLLRAEGFLRVSMARSGLVTPYYEPLNGYFRYGSLQTALVYGQTRIKRDFPARISGRLGRIRLLGRRIGTPGDLTLYVRQGSALVATVTAAQAGAPDWIDWITLPVEDAVVQAGVAYTLELAAASGDSANCYEFQASTADAPFSGGYYASVNGGADWSEDAGRGLIFRSWLIHDDEYLLKIKKVKYQASADKGVTADIDLGRVDKPLDQRIIDLLRAGKAEALLQQSNVADLSA